MFDRPKTQDELDAILDISWSYYNIAKAYTFLGDETKARNYMLLHNAILNLIKLWG